MSKRFFLKWYGEDFDRDCSILSLSARGAWITIINYLFRCNGARTLSILEWSRVINSSEKETMSAIMELARHSVCDIDFPQVGHADCHSLVTIESRRLSRDASLRESATKRKGKERSRKSHKQVLENVTILDAKMLRNAKILRPLDCANSESGTLNINKSSLPASATKNRRLLTDLPNDFQVSEGMANWAKENGFDGGEEQTAKFLDYHRAKGSRFKDWPAAWRTWCRNSKDFARGPAGNGSHRPGAHIGAQPAPEETTPAYRAHMAQLNEETARRLQELDGEAKQSKFVADWEEI